MKTSTEFLEFLHDWKGTPYANKMREKGRGVDCVNFIVAYSDWLADTDSEVLGLPKLLGYNDPKETLSVIKFLERGWANTLVDFKDKRLTEVLMPGDVIATQNGTHPVHLVLAGPKRGTIWHASNERPIPGIPNQDYGVRVSALGTATTLGINRIWRLEAAENMKWLEDTSDACC